ncbi:UDP-N-acetylglucosamine pyrophosphorylase [Lobosporangium transversale]|uniref:UDP-N-acetylglucosamine diphosphorylase n=1 Tax=Lobosporangium transversale TaxID=64571 RepID=A0A1Y2GGU2_9FUNG|nr:nucleotide-diphospho-sugar transferase [Lobosporangium transversale]KAF9914554.1 UDP-N-acetylglucosamine pyrophosphorylase [Lobosporangium transversale]ORZ09120.1 nucleotide-diphospho-sugar transferase [Lobosporangium transversale]|eukprot:XP_021878747.1 nucleotide-diphospho-sugar transferase [Lobosporangium transversale]
MVLDRPRVEAVQRQYTAAGQGHVFTFWDNLTEQEQEAFLAQLESFDPAALNVIFSQATAASNNTSSIFADLTPLEQSEVKSTLSCSAEEKEEWRLLGMEAIANNHVAVVLLAGGQGTRLGTLLPKGCYRDIGLPSHKTLFQIQAERILKLQELARIEKAKRTHQAVESIPEVVVPWCIMTSGPTRHQTEVFLKEHEYFGLSPENIIIFEQGVIPCFGMDGKFLLNHKNLIATSPNGNGGLYWALHSEKVLEELQERGIRYIHCYSVDNILIKIGDPVGIGHAIKEGSDVTAKAAPKTVAAEPLGVICRLGGKIKVVEYSEMDPELAVLEDRSTGELVYRAGNICNQICSLDFLQKIANILKSRDQSVLIYHQATKKIPYVDLESGHLISPKKPNGIKLELFIFDVFPVAERFACLEVERSREFSPIKNSSGLDSPSTARRDLERLHIRWIEEAGGHVQGGDVFKSDGPTKMRIGFEIGPRLSYAGEGLEWVKGKTILPGILENQEDAAFVDY